MSKAAQGQGPAEKPTTGLGGGRLIGPAALAAMPLPWPAEVDCDELAMFVGALLLANGVACQIVTVSTNPQDPMRFNHVYVQAVLDDGTKVPLDPQGPEPGWEPHWIRRKEWPVMMPEPQEAVEPTERVLP